MLTRFSYKSCTAAPTEALQKQSASILSLNVDIQQKDLKALRSDILVVIFSIRPLWKLLKSVRSPGHCMPVQYPWSHTLPANVCSRWAASLWERWSGLRSSAGYSLAIKLSGLPMLKAYRMLEVCNILQVLHALGGTDLVKSVLPSATSNCLPDCNDTLRNYNHQFSALVLRN